MGRTAPIDNSEYRSSRVFFPRSLLLLPHDVTGISEEDEEEEKRDRKYGVRCKQTPNRKTTMAERARERENVYIYTKKKKLR